MPSHTVVEQLMRRRYSVHSHIREWLDENCGEQQWSVSIDDGLVYVTVPSENLAVMFKLRFA